MGSAQPHGLAVNDLRPGEVTTEIPAGADTAVYFLGRLRTPWLTREQCPKRGDPKGGPACRVEVDLPWRAALAGLDRCDELDLLYWMHLARRDLVLQMPRTSTHPHGTFALRSPMRPNPIASSTVTLVGVEADGLVVRGLDCMDGTPLIDIKPRRCPMWTDPTEPGRR